MLDLEKGKLLEHKAKQGTGKLKGEKKKTQKEKTNIKTALFFPFHPKLDVMITVKESAAIHTRCGATVVIEVGYGCCRTKLLPG